MMMKQLGHRYAQYFNRSYGRSGPLWGGRYYSCIAESAYYVLACYRYIELNPVRAGLVRLPGDYRWSSHSANTEGAAGEMLSPHKEFLALGVDEEARRRVYGFLFAEQIETALLKRIREATVGGYPLASNAFKEAVAAKLGTKLQRGRPGPKRGGSNLGFGA